MTEKEMDEFFEETKRESILLFSCVKPDTIFNVSKIWGYESDTLYNVKQSAIDHKFIIPLNSPDGIGEEKLLKTNMDVLFGNLSRYSIVSAVDDEIKGLYFNNKYLSQVLYVENLRKIFPDRNLLYEYYYEIMPVLLVFLPVCIKLYQYENSMSAIGTMTLEISMRMARRIGDRNKHKNDLRQYLIYKGIYYLVEKFKDVKLPKTSVSRLYKYVSKVEDFRAYPLERDIMSRRLTKAKYRQFD